MSVVSAVAAVTPGLLQAIHEFLIKANLPSTASCLRKEAQMTDFENTGPGLLEVYRGYLKKILLQQPQTGTVPDKPNTAPTGGLFTSKGMKSSKGITTPMTAKASYSSESADKKKKKGLTRSMSMKGKMMEEEKPPPPPPKPLNMYTVTQDCTNEVAMQPNMGEYIYYMMVDNGLLYTAGGDGYIKIWSTEEASPMGVLSAHSGAVHALASSSYGLLASGGADTFILLWDIATRQLVDKLRGHAGTIYALTILSNLLFSGSGDNSVKIWDLDTRECIQTLRGHKRPVLAVAAIDRYLYTAGGDRRIRLWEVATGQMLRKLKGHEADINCLHLIDDRMFSGSSDCTVRIWDCWTQECMAVIRKHTLSVFSVTSVGKVLYTAGLDNDIYAWSLDRGIIKPVGDNSTISSDMDSQQQTAQTPSGAATPTPHDDDPTQWGLGLLPVEGTLAYMTKLTGHTGCIYGLASDGEHLFSAGIDCKLKQWSKRKPPLPRSMLRAKPKPKPED